MVRGNLTCSSGIYQIKSKINGKIYIGSAIKLKRRRIEHISGLNKIKHGNAKLQNHVNKYGIHDLIFGIIEFCSKENLIKREQYYIDTLNPEFNICKIAGSSLGVKHSIEYRKRVSILKKGNKNNLNHFWTPEMKEKASIRSRGVNNPNFGLKRSEETKQKQRGKRGPYSELFRQKCRHPKSEEHKRKMRLNKLGTKHTEETKRKMSETHKKIKYKHPDEVRKNISKTKKERHFKHSEESIQKMRDKRILYHKNKKLILT